MPGAVTALDRASAAALVEFTGALLAVLLLERLVHAVTFFVVDTLLGSGEGALKRVASINSVQELFAWGVELLYSVPAALAALLQYVLARVLRLAALCALFVVLVLLYRASPGFVLDSVYVYNARIAPVLRGFLLTPLQYTDLVFSPLAAAYNAAVYVLQGLVVHVLFPAIRSAPSPFLQAATAFADVVRELSLSVVVWWGSLYGDCATSGVVRYILQPDSTEPVAVANATASEINCFEPGMRSLNLMSPMAKLRVFVAHAAVFAKLSCGALSPLFDVWLYPFLDINLGKTVHNLVNALLFWLVHTPIVTLERCAQSREHDAGAAPWVQQVMCLPDLAPGWNMLISATRHAGLLLDNWLNTLFVVVATALGLPVPACVQLDLELKAVTEETLFGGNESRVVGLTTGAYAVTDGVSTQYNLFAGQLTQVYAPDNWPLAVDPRLGIAAVRYDVDDEIEATSLQQTMSMLGCRCEDVFDADAYKGSRMQITCAIARYSPELAGVRTDEPNATWRSTLAETLVTVDFALPSTAGYMTCAESKIVVDSVRWPVYRVAVPGEFRDLRRPLDEFVNADGVDGPVEIDAVVWVVPACSTTGAAEPVCRADFPDTACFPFCAAVRRTGAHNDGLLLYSAADWETHVQLLRRDCSASFDAASADISYGTDARPKAYTGAVERRADFYGGSATISAWDAATRQCVYNDVVSSRLQRQALTDSEISRYGAVLLPEQPFAVAGDVVLTATQDSAGRHLVKVQRMYGLEGSDMVTLITVNNRLPANAPCFTPEECVSRGVVNEQDFTVPYSWFSTPLNHNPAVASKWAVFFAVNPSLRMFSEFFKYCKGDPTSQLQFAPTTSYAPIRLWRVDAFAYHDPENGHEADSTGAWVELEDPFLKQLDAHHCSQSFNVMVTSMEYLNDANIAVQVLHTRPSYYDTSSSSTWGNDPADVQYRTYFLHPRRMALRRFEMWPDDEAPAALAQGLLCPSQRRMPELGSMLAETAAALMYVGRVVTEFLSVAVVIFQQGAYREISACVPLTRGHSFLRNCAQGFLDFDPFFLAVARGNQLFWNSLSKVGAFVSGTAAGDNVQQFLNGVALAAQTQHYPLFVGRARRFVGAAGEVARELRANPVESFKQVAGMPALLRSAFRQTFSWVRAAHYLWRMVKRALMYTVFNLRPSGGAAVMLWQAVYDSVYDYDTFVLDTQLQSCVGVSLMFGYSNPLAGLAREICQASALFQKGVLSVAMVFFVDVPTLACLCQQASTVDFRENAARHCWEPAPEHMRGLLRAIIADATWPDEICLGMYEVATANLESSFSGFVDAAYRAIDHIEDATASVLHTATDAQPCHLQFATNPHVVSIVPDPVDYWRICGSTTTCRMKCRADFEAFEALRDGRHLQPGAGSVSTGTVDVESQFFADEDVVAGRSLAPFSVMDMVELADCSVVCNEGSAAHTSDRCISIAGIAEQATPQVVQVADYCVPAAMDVPVFQHALWTVAGSEAWVGELRLLRLLHHGRALCHLYADGACSLVAVLADRVALYRSDGAEYRVLTLGRLETQLQRVLQLFVFSSESVVLYGTGLEHGGGEQASPRVVHKSFCFAVSADRAWGAYTPARCDGQTLFSALDPSVPSCLMSGATGRCASVLRVPATADASVRVCAVGDAATGLVQRDESCVTLPHNSGAARAAGLLNVGAVSGIVRRETWVQSPMHSRPVIAATVSALGETSAHYGLLAANHPDRRSVWLSEMRVSKSNAHLEYLSSMQLRTSVSVQHTCSVHNCMGCAGDVQRMCFVAQQCAIVKCIGTTVNLEQPLCAAGKLLAEYTERALVAWYVSASLMLNHLVVAMDMWRASRGARAASKAAKSGGATSSGATSSGAKSGKLGQATQVVQRLTGAMSKRTWRLTTPDTGKVRTLAQKALSQAMDEHICEMKDTIVAGTGLLTSVLNSLLGLLSVPVYGDPVSELQDEYTDASNTIMSSSLTFMLSQLALGLVYPMIVVKKMIMCQANDLFAILDFTGLELRLMEAQYADMTDALTGRCLTDFYSEAAQESVPPAQSFRSAISSVFGQTLEFVVTLPFGDLKHTIDAGLAYLISIVRGAQDFIATVDRVNCKMPDATAEDVPTCACGDTPVRVPHERAVQGLRESALWCTGTLQMVSQFGTPRIVYNPYTYAELLVEMQRTQDVYLACISRDGESGQCGASKPSLPRLAEQGVSTMAVFVRCKANYNNKQWDEAAAALYADEKPSDMQDAVWATLLDERAALLAGAADGMHSALAECMRNTLANGVSNDACLVDVALFAYNLKRERYFAYEAMGAGDVGTAAIAACEVFTGPAQNGVAEFQDCIDGAGSGACFIQPFAWSGRSSNKVPVATAHAYMSFAAADRAAAAAAAHRATRDKVAAALGKLGWDPLAKPAPTTSWSGDGVQVSLFTSEGDVLHQAFDCAVLGPYGSAELWPTDVERQLPTLEYYRDTQGGATRDFELPCAGAALQGDGQGPFTCGSPARRAIIKYFMRNVTRISTGGANAGVKDAVVQAVRTNILRAGALYASGSAYGCDCPAAADVRLQPTHVLCCAMLLGGFDPHSQSLSALPGAEQRALLDNFLPGDVRDFAFAAVQEQLSVDGLMQSIVDFLDGELWSDANNSALRAALDGDAGAALAWDAAQRELAADEGLFGATGELRGYDAAEAAPPLHASPLQMCMGLVSQVLFTLPVRRSDAYTEAAGDARDVPTTLDGLAGSFDPMAESPDAHLSTLEHFVAQVVRDAALRSPVHWSHWLRHLPSESLVCEHEPAPAAPAGGNASATNALDGAAYEALAAAAAPAAVEHTTEGVSVDGLLLFVPSGADGAAPVFRSAPSRDAAIGAVRRNCFCGWAHTDAAPGGRRHCRVPATVCRHRDWALLGGDVGPLVALACAERAGMYDHAEHDHAFAVFFQTHWGAHADMVCPLMAPSSAWGVSNASQMHAWLRGDAAHAAVNTRDVAAEGRAGLRMGNIAAVLGEYYTHFNPAQRGSPLYHPTERDAPGHAQRHCLAGHPTNGSSARHGQGDGAGAAGGNLSAYARAWVDDLIPVVQGVEEARAPAFCRRYAVELGLLAVYEHALGAEHSTTAAQAAAAGQWKRRCKTQMKALGFCALRGVFRAARAEGFNPRCPSLQVTVPDGDASRAQVADNCVVVAVDGATGDAALYDPCTCAGLDPEPGRSVCSFAPGGAVPAAAVPLAALRAECVPLDPLSLVGDTARLHTLRWSSLESDSAHWQQQPAYAAAVAAAHARYHALNVQTDELETGNALADMRLESLWTEFVRPLAAGPPNGTVRGSDAGAACGAISDWWPETWAYPVGYHPTVPCGAHGEPEPALRSFSNYLVHVDGLGLVYMHTALRDKARSRSDSGTTGVCRAGSLAVRSHELNNARVCTRQRRNVQADYAVPVGGAGGESAAAVEEYFAEECAEAAGDVPWDAGDSQNPALAASGLLAAWPADGGALWPPLGQQVDVPTLGLPAHLQSDSWAPPGAADSACGMPPLLTCATDADCVARAAHATARSAGVRMRCLNSVCVVAEAPADEWNSGGAAAFDCVEHSHCADGLLCSGEGRCVLPVVEIWNEREPPLGEPRREDVEIEWHTRAGRCDAAAAVDTFGHSAWGDVDGLLPAHGLCSYRNWYEYNQLFREHCAAAPAPQHAGSTCELQRAGESVWPTTSRDAGYESMFAQGRMQMRAHACDRDYQHLKGFELCQPAFAPLGATRVRYDAFAEQVIALEAYEHELPGDYAKLLHTYFRSSADTAESASLENLKLNLVQMAHMHNLQAGWLGTDAVFEEDAAAGGAEELGLTRCDQIPQCSLPEYTVQGRVVPVRLVARGAGNAYSLYNYRVRDAVYCGAFGKEGQTTAYQSTPPEDFCSIDEAVLPMFQMLCDSSARAALLASGCAFALSGAALDETCAAAAAPYASGDRVLVQQALNTLLVGAFETGFATMHEYAQRMQCADAVWTQLQRRRNFATDPARKRQFMQYTDATDGDDSVSGTPLWSDSALYVFTEYAMVELPFAWWLKCHLLSGLRPRHTAGSVAEQLECDAWTNSLRAPALRSGELASMSTHEYLRTYAPLLGTDAVARAAAALEAEHLAALEEAAERVRTRVTEPDADGAYPDIVPSCYMHQKFQESESCVAKQGAEQNDNQLQFAQMLYQVGYNYGSLNSAGPLRCCTPSSQFSLQDGAASDACTVRGNLVQQSGAGAPDVLDRVHAFVALELAGAEFLAPLADAEIMQQPVFVRDAADAVNGTLFPLFEHTWLRRDGDATLDVYVRGFYDEALRDSSYSECETVRVGALLDTKADGQAAARCVFADYTDDPEFTNSGFGDNTKPEDPPYVILSSYNTGRVDSAGVADNTKARWTVADATGDATRVQSGMDVCAVSDTTSGTATWLGQSCSLRNQETFTCDASEKPFTCGSDNTLKSPAENFVCYEQTNKCFDARNTWSLPFNQHEALQWVRGWLPPGVQLVTYGYPQDSATVIGRNPRYQGSDEKLFWHNQHFFNRPEVDTLIEKTGAHEPRAACNMREIVITVLCGVAVLLVPHVTRALPTHKLNRENLEQQIRRLQRMNGQLQLDKVQLRKELARVQQRNHDLLASLA